MILTLFFFHLASKYCHEIVIPTPNWKVIIEQCLAIVYIFLLHFQSHLGANSHTYVFTKRISEWLQLSGTKRSRNVNRDEVVFVLLKGCLRVVTFDDVNALASEKQAYLRFTLSPRQLTSCWPLHDCNCSPPPSPVRRQMGAFAPAAGSAPSPDGYRLRHSSRRQGDGAGGARLRETMDALRQRGMTRYDARIIAEQRLRLREPEPTGGACGRPRPARTRRQPGQDPLQPSVSAAAAPPAALRAGGAGRQQSVQRRQRRLQRRAALRAAPNGGQSERGDRRLETAAPSRRQKTPPPDPDGLRHHPGVGLTVGERSIAAAAAAAAAVAVAAAVDRSFPSLSTTMEYLCRARSAPPGVRMNGRAGRRAGCVYLRSVYTAAFADCVQPRRLVGALSGLVQGSIPLR